MGILPDHYELKEAAELLIQIDSVAKFCESTAHCNKCKLKSLRDCLNLNLDGVWPTCCIKELEKLRSELIQYKRNKYLTTQPKKAAEVLIGIDDLSNYCHSRDICAECSLSPLSNRQDPPSTCWKNMEMLRDRLIEHIRAKQSTKTAELSKSTSIGNALKSFPNQADNSFKSN